MGVLSTYPGGVFVVGDRSVLCFLCFSGWHALEAVIKWGVMTMTANLLLLPHSNQVGE